MKTSPAELARPTKPKSERANNVPAPSRGQDGQADVPPEKSFDPWARAAQVALIGLFIIALLWCAYVARAVIVPVLLAWVIATIMLPVVRWLERHRVPRVLGVLLLTIALIGLIAALLTLLSTPIAVWLARASELTVLLKQKLQTISQPLALLEEARKSISAITDGNQPTLKVEQESAGVITAIFSVITPAISQSILFVGALVFYLIYRVRVRNTVVLLFTDRDARLKMLHILSDVDESMSRYFGAFTLVNVALGAVTTLLTWAVGLPNPLLWGVLAGVLNYIPYIGPGIVTATLAVVGLLTYPMLSQALVPPLIFLAVVTIEGQFLTPAFIGHRLELNPFAVFLSVAISTWLMGPLGAFLAVPLLIAFSITIAEATAREKPDLPE
jgi:predicted PurR-regulated permease PerM